MSAGDDRLEREVLKCAERVVQMSRDRAGEVLDFTDGSIDVVEEMLAEAAAYARQMSEAKLRRLSQDIGCYVLEAARRSHGGVYQWSEERNEPALVVGEPFIAVTLFCWEKVYARLRGDASAGIPAFYASFVQGIRQANQGDRIVYV